MPVVGAIPAEILDRWLAAGGSDRCLLLVHADVGKLAAVAEQLTERHEWTRFPIGGPLSRALRDVAPRHRVGAVQRWMGQVLGRAGPGQVVCTEIDLLFEPQLDPTGELRLDPLDLFVQMSRQTRLVVAWPGGFDGQRLSYAVPAHAHYRSWPRPAALVAPLR
jgi:hypothetical protein